MTFNEVKDKIDIKNITVSVVNAVYLSVGKIVYVREIHDLATVKRNRDGRSTTVHDNVYFFKEGYSKTASREVWKILYIDTLSV